MISYFIIIIDEEIKSKQKTRKSERMWVKSEVSNINLSKQVFLL